MGTVFVPLNVSPAGSEPTLKLVGELLAAMVYVLIAVPAVPLSVIALVMTGVPSAGSTTNVTEKLLVAPLDVSEMVPLDVPAVVGVPLIRPVAALIEIPAGRPVAP